MRPNVKLTGNTGATDLGEAGKADRRDCLVERQLGHNFPRRNTMRILLRWIGRKCGMTTWYHIAAMYPLPNGSATMSMTCEVRPWLHSDNYQELVAYVKAQADSTTTTPNIVSITRLGA